MPESLLTILKFVFLGLLYLFFLRVVRAVWAEVTAPKAAPAAAVAAAPAATRTKERTTSGKPARLRIVEPAAARGKTYDLADELTIGRGAGCQIPLDDSFASQVHARLFRRNSDILVEDLGSTNGTFLNRKKVDSPVPIRKGDRLQVGKTVLELTK